MDSSPVRVLLVEDDEDYYALTRELLGESEGATFDLEWAGTYEEGLQALRALRHDVYLLDHRLGARHGLELLREALTLGCKAPLILLTAHGERGTDLAAMQAGAADFLVKENLDARLLERSLRYAIERKRAEEALRRARDELELRVAERTAELLRANEALRDADRRKDEFLAMLSHELRNPLAPLLNGLHVLKTPGADAGAVEKARAAMERQIGHLARIVEDLLDVSRIQGGQVVLRRERLDLGRLARATAEDHRPAFEHAGVALEYELPELPVWVLGDPTRLAQVLGNLLDNAARFTDRGGRVTVRLAVEADPARAVLTVRDTGVGIGAGLLPHLFEVFTQADRSLERTKGGLGLGLALVKGLTELHGGEVRATSPGPGRGAEFVVRLPAQPEPAALSNMPAAPGRAPQRLRILVVEDNQDSADMLQMLLGLYGHEVRVAYTGPAGVRAAQEWGPDAIVCDIGLPGLDGYAVAGELRRHPATSKARLIAVTGYGQEEDRRRALKAGFDHHLTKPVDPDALLGLLARAA